MTLKSLFNLRLATGISSDTPADGGTSAAVLAHPGPTSDASKAVGIADANGIRVGTTTPTVTTAQASPTTDTATTAGTINSAPSVITFAGAPFAVTLVWKVLGAVYQPLLTMKWIPLLLSLLIGTLIYLASASSGNTPNKKALGLVFALINSFAIAATVLGIASI
jgi:hypothetical protein